MTGLMRRRRAGMSLIEVMVAIVLLSFGLVGMLGLKMTGLRMAAHSQSRSVAAIHAAEILDRMRANPVRARAGEYAIALGASAPGTPGTVAQLDLAEWRLGIQQNLPSGTGSVVVQPDGRVAVTVQWSERMGDASETQTLAFTFEGRL